MRRRANPTPKTSSEDFKRYGVHETPTGTACPGHAGVMCGHPQFFCPSGVACEDGHGFVEPSELVLDAGARFSYGIPEILPHERDESIAGAAFEHLSEEPAKGSISGDLGVVERDFEIDFDAEYRALKKALTLRTPADQASLGVLTRALDEAHENIRRSHVLACVAEHRLEMFEIDAEIAWADLRSRAIEKLTEERKRHGARAKAITDADVRGMLAHVDPVGWREHVSKKKKIELAAEHVKKLADAWRLRATALDTMVKAKK